MLSLDHLLSAQYPQKMSAPNAPKSSAATQWDLWMLSVHSTFYQLWNRKTKRSVAFTIIVLLGIILFKFQLARNTGSALYDHLRGQAYTILIFLFAAFTNDFGPKGIQSGSPSIARAEDSRRQSKCSGSRYCSLSTPRYVIEIGQHGHCPLG